ncbi:atlastin-like [Sitodiplosis mosellana]|uniref:atlastin-like n=1 Tax=Sitodiplosis mosellana TaxID=263140 RepID=UPI002444F2D5|nr:atlastin-like [Sitodiplosis mosellana]
MKIGCVLTLAVAVFCQKVSSDELDSVSAIQIVSPKDHVFNLELDGIKSILENDSIKDRNVVVVSIAGAFRQGKSFLLNFFIKYLYAQYKKHDVSDWLGEENNSSGLTGFKWRSGRKRETTGIWMWSEVFTHDFSNGEKVAIILLDTQGIFDDQSSVRDCTTIFALSMMLSSVQCYNVMQNIKEDDLQHLELFTEYGRLALEESTLKPFQKLLFIVRDWPYAFETDYGWHGQKIIDEIMTGNEEQTNDMRQLRRRIDSSFDDIGAFLMPHPGSIVARGNSFTGNIHQISAEFRKYVKELVRGIFAPDKLIVKTMNGGKVRVRDLIPYLQAYLNIFNGDALPEPKTVFMATAEASMQIMLTDCVNYYVDTMQKLINGVTSYFSQIELITAHQKTKGEAIGQFQSKPKLGGDRFVSSFQKKIEAEIEEKFVAFNQTNEAKYKHFVEMANLNNDKICAEIKATFENELVNQIDKSSLKSSDVHNLLANLKQSALQRFDSEKMGDGDISNGFRGKLTQNLDGIQSSIIKASESYHECLNHYTDASQRSLASIDTFFNQNDLIKAHQNAKKEAKDQFSERTTLVDLKYTSTLQHRLENEIEAKLPALEQSNEGKRHAFVERANAHNGIISGEIGSKFNNQVLNGIGTNYLSDDSFFSLFISSKRAALDEFATRKMGDGDISNVFREKLERDLDNMQAALKQRNEANKPPPPPKKKRKGWKKVVGAVVNAAAHVAGAAIASGV